MKKIGLQLALQLPHDRKKLLEILDYTRWLVENYIHKADREAVDPARPPALKVVG